MVNRNMRVEFRHCGHVPSILTIVSKLYCINHCNQWERFCDRRRTNSFSLTFSPMSSVSWIHLLSRKTYSFSFINLARIHSCLSPSLTPSFFDRFCSEPVHAYGYYDDRVKWIHGSALLCSEQYLCMKAI